MDLLSILQGLGSNEVNKKENSISLLSNFLRNQVSIKEEGLLKRLEKYEHIWNSIFFYFWNTDKPAVQKAAAEGIASLFSSVKDKDNFILTCIVCFNSKWSKIDFHRMDKYIMLMDTLYERFFNYSLSKGKFKVRINKLCD